MTLSTLFLASLLANTPPAETATNALALVDRLGSPRYAEREQAANDLANLGAPAIDPLRTARHHRDPEVRARAAALLDRIQGQLMVQPTLVPLDFRDRPLLEVAQDFGRRAHAPLVPANAEQDPQLWQNLVTLRSPEPVPFWTALDRLCQAGSLRWTGNFGPFGGAGDLVLIPRPIDHNAPPTSDSGPFRVKLVQLHYERNRSFDNAADAPAEEFRLSLEAWAEPRLLISQSGPLSLTEAADDLGRSLLSPDATAHRLAFAPAPDNLPDPSAIPFDPQPLTRGRITLSAILNFPRSPAPATLRRFRGSLPVSVATRKPDPLVIPLASAIGKSFGVDGEIRVDVRAIKPGSDATELTVIELVARPGKGASATRPGFGPGPDPSSAPPLFAALEHQIEVLDARGRHVPWSPMELEPEPDGVRLSLGTLPDDDSDDPATLRIHDLSHASAHIPFDFHDIRTP